MLTCLTAGSAWYELVLQDLNYFYQRGESCSTAAPLREDPKAAVPNHFGTRDRFVENNFSTDGGGWGMVQAVCERWGAADETSLARPLLTSCCVVPGVGDPCPKE